MAKSLRVLLVAGVAYVGITAVLASFQNQLIYFPSRASESELTRLATGLGMQAWRAKTGESHGWKSSNENAANRIVVFHGNAGYALHRSYYVEGFQRIGSGGLWQIHLFEYPGYGARSGEPGEAQFMEAAEAALLDLSEDQRPVYLLGESIGAGVACQLAARHPTKVAGLFLVTPFTTLADVAAHHYPFLPVRMLLGDAYNSVAALEKYRGPVAVLIAGRDEVIPSRLGRELFDKYAGRKKLWIQPRATHNDIDYSVTTSWWSEVSDFLLKQ
jgi:uncharacterized protein